MSLSELNKKVSVLLPIRNEGVGNLKMCFESLFKQTFQDFEIIIIDDSDNDATIEAIDKFNDEAKDLGYEVIVIRDNPSKSVAGALNHGLKFCKGDFIARVDSDDVSVSTRFEKQIGFLLNNPDYDIVGSYYAILENNHVTSKTVKFPISDSNIKRLMFIRCAVAHPTLLIRKSFFTKIGNFDETLKRAEDYDLWLRAIKLNTIKFKNLPISLLYFRKTSITEKNRRQNTARDLIHWETNLLIKIRNFNGKYFFFSILGISFQQLFIWMPSRIKNFIYNTLN